jgi:hypothetical protein
MSHTEARRNTCIGVTLRQAQGRRGVGVSEKRLFLCLSLRANIWAKQSQPDGVKAGISPQGTQRGQLETASQGKANFWEKSLSLRLSAEASCEGGNRYCVKQSRALWRKRPVFFTAENAENAEKGKSGLGDTCSLMAPRPERLSHTEARSHRGTPVSV